MPLKRKNSTLCQDIFISNIGHDRSSVCGISLYIHGSTAVDPQIFISKSIYPLIFILVYPWIYRSVISADPQIPVSLHPWVHRSLDFWISGSMDLNITIFMHWQILVSLHPWILWPWYVYIPRSLDPNISTSMGPKISGFLDLWIYGS